MKRSTSETACWSWSQTPAESETSSNCPGPDRENAAAPLADLRRRFLATLVQLSP